MSQIDELRTTIGEKDQEITDCRKANRVLQISVQQLESRLEKCEKNTCMDSTKIQELERKIDVLSSYPLPSHTFTFSLNRGKTNHFESETFNLPSIPYRFRITASFEEGRIYVRLMLYQPPERVETIYFKNFSFKVYCPSNIFDTEEEKIESREIRFDNSDSLKRIAREGFINFGYFVDAHFARFKSLYLFSRGSPVTLYLKIKRISLLKAVRAGSLS